MIQKSLRTLASLVLVVSLLLAFSCPVFAEDTATAPFQVY